MELSTFYWFYCISQFYIYVRYFSFLYLPFTLFYIYLCKNEHLFVRSFRRKILLQMDLQFINADAIILGFLLIPIFDVFFLDEKFADKFLINRVILLLLQKGIVLFVNQPFCSIHPFCYLIFYRIFFRK